jgi:YD repeat-containing protein
LGRTTKFEYDAFYRISKTTSPDLSWWQYSYDDRGNRTSLTHYPVPGSALPPQVTESSAYPASCTNALTCNKPTSVTDAKGNQTDYTYSPDHGGVITKTGPAVNGIRQETRYEYAQRYAWIKSASGTYVQAASPVWVLMATRTCRTTATVGNACAGGPGDEVVTAYDYGPDSGPNNLLPHGVAVTADGQTLRNCYGYDRLGNRISETKPAAGLTICP